MKTALRLLALLVRSPDCSIIITVCTVKRPPNCKLKLTLGGVANDAGKLAPQFSANPFSVTGNAVFEIEMKP